MQDLGVLENIMASIGPLPTPLEAMAAASGHTREVKVYTIGLGKPRAVSRRIINAEGRSLFKEGYTCPWKKAGVWTDEGGEPRLLKRDHFALYQGRPVNFVDDFLSPFMERFIQRMRDCEPKTIAFIEGIPTGIHPSWSKEKADGVVNAFHCYDGVTLFTKFFCPWFNIHTDTAKPILGKKRVAAHFRDSLGESVTWAREHMGDMPSFLGEFGLPFDLNKKRAYKTGKYGLHETALSMYYDAIDANLLHSTIWHYVPDNTNDHGDNWNDEDLSIYCAGPRAMGGWLRPYPMATAGEPLSIHWDRKKGLFRYQYRADPAITAPTEIFAPRECLGTKPLLTLTSSAGEAIPALKAEYNPDRNRVFITNQGFAGELILSVRREGRA
jgi:hypothetical protein